MTLHTLYRPQTFDEVLGQDAAVKSFKTAIKNNTCRAFLFFGPSGVGKTTLARIGAKQMGSTERDIQEINAAKFTGVDDMRTLTNSIEYRPFGENAFKSIILDEAHQLSKASWNSILKYLEEPPPWVGWFLCTTELNKVPETIKTRCARYELKPVAKQLLFELISSTAKLEKYKLSDGILELCAKEANGSPRQALVNLGVCSEARDRVEAAELLKSAAEGSRAFDLAKALLEGRGWPVIQRILTDLKDENPESVRQVVRDYITKVVLGTDREDRAGPACEILDAFIGPFLSGDGISPVVLACAKVVLSE